MMKHPKARKWITFTLRWGIAVVGIWWVLAKTPFRDRVLLLDAQNQLVQTRALHEPGEDATQFEVIDPRTGKNIFVDRAEVWTQPDSRNVKIELAGKIEKAKLLAIRPGPHYRSGDEPAELLVLCPEPGESARPFLSRAWSSIKGFFGSQAGRPMLISPAQVPGGYHVRVPYPLVDIGVVRLVEHARLGFLLAALLVLPLSYFITSRRWHLLLEALDIHISQATAFVLNMVGSFYNSFMPGSTGGDLVKAYYAAKHTTHKVRAVLSVIVDRLIGVIALIILGGIMALTQWSVPDCRRVAIVSMAMLSVTAVGLIVFYKRSWRQSTGLNWLLKRMPMQKQVHHAVEAMELYGKRPRAAFTALLMTFPVHITTIVSGTLAGIAFGIDQNHMPLTYYWTVVPVITLVAALPISPQGAGVMEAFAVLLTKNHGVTVTQAIGLANALRFGQMFWNLLAGLFVLRGGYHAPSQSEQEEMEADEDEPDAHNRDVPKSESTGEQPRPAGGSVQPT